MTHARYWFSLLCLVGACSSTFTAYDSARKESIGWFVFGLFCIALNIAAFLANYIPLVVKKPT